MSDPAKKILLGSHSSRELDVKVTATPEALRDFANFLSAAVTALPSPLVHGEDIYVKGFEIVDASGSKRESFISFRAEPSLDWLPTRQRRKGRNDKLAFALVSVAGILALIGLSTVLKWIF
jgi:hypothetical protein